MNESGREAMEAFLTAFRSLDRDGQFSRMHPDVVISEPPALPYGGEWRGHDGWRNLTRSIRETLALVPSGFAHRIFAEDEDGEDFILMTRLKGTVIATGEPFESSVLEHWRVVDGLIVSIRPHYFDTRVTQPAKA